MENEESALRAAENQVNRAENKLQGTNQKRDWYQVLCRYNLFYRHHMIIDEIRKRIRKGTRYARPLFWNTKQKHSRQKGDTTG